MLVGLSGIIALVSVPIKTLSDDVYEWLPFNPYHIESITAIALGISLVYLATQLRRKKVTAYLLTYVLLFLLTAIEAIVARHIELATVYAIILAYLISQRKQYVVRNDFTSLRRNVTVSLVMLVVIAGSSILTFARIDQKEFGRNLKTSETLNITMDAMLGDDLPDFLHPTRTDKALLYGLQITTIISGLIILVGLFYPIRMRKLSSKRSRQRAQTILEKFSASSEDYLKLWPRDKHYYFYKDSFLAYGVASGVAIVLDGASGDKQWFNGLRHNFVQECRINGWQPTIVHADVNEREAWINLGFSSLYLGSEARVNIAEFYENKIGGKHFRYVKNRAIKEGLTVNELEHPLIEDTLASLRQVSNHWLASGRREYRFIMGYFDKDYLSNCRIFVLYKNDGMIAYTNLLPQYQDINASIDHMRFTDSIPPIGMHFLLMNVLKKLHDSNFKTLNMGLAPLSKLEDNTQTISKNILNIIRNFGNRYYSFAGLEQFKNKFGPMWEPTYLLYNGFPNKLATIGAAGSSLATYKQSKVPTKILLIVAGIVGICYASFPLASILNPQLVWRGVVSRLGQSGQPYSYVFNSLDIISSSVGLILAIYLLVVVGRKTKLLHYAIISLLISNLGSILSAFFRLPAGINIDERVSLALLSNKDVVIHLLTSVLNTGAFLIALLLWGVWYYRKLGFGWRSKFILMILSFDIIAFAVGQYYPDIGSVFQRLFIICYAIWIVLFTRDILNNTHERSNLPALSETLISKAS